MNWNACLIFHPFKKSFPNTNMAYPIPSLAEINQTSLLETIGANGQAPKSRLTNERKTQAFIGGLIEADKERSRKDAQLAGMFNGNSPYNPSKLIL